MISAPWRSASPLLDDLRGMIRFNLMNFIAITTDHSSYCTELKNWSILIFMRGIQRRNPKPFFYAISKYRLFFFFSLCFYSNASSNKYMSCGKNENKFITKTETVENVVLFLCHRLTVPVLVNECR